MRPLVPVAAAMPAADLATKVARIARHIPRDMFSVPDGYDAWMDAYLHGDVREQARACIAAGPGSGRRRMGEGMRIWATLVRAADRLADAVGGRAARALLVVDRRRLDRALLAEVVRPEGGDPTHRGRAPDDSPGRVLDTHLSIASPHGPTGAGVMLAA